MEHTTVRIADARVSLEYARARLTQRQTRCALGDALASTNYAQVATDATEARRQLLVEWSNGSEWDIDKPVA